MKKKYEVIIAGVLLSIMLMGGNYLTFGVWNPLSTPEKLNCFGRLYRISNLEPKTLKEDEIPAYWIRQWSWTGKSLYSLEPSEKNIPTVIYLKKFDGKYQLYSLSGSN